MAEGTHNRAIHELRPAATSGLRPGDKVTGDGMPLSIPLGPAILGNIFDGLLRPLSAESGDYVEPGMFGIGPVPAVRQALDRAGWKIGDVQRVEINEAFAAIALACLRELGLSEDVVNVEGGAIAHGHPIGATGAVLTTRLLHSMARDGLKRGVVTLCIGGGQGIALALEAV